MKILHDLKPATVESLEELIRVNLDSYRNLVQAYEASDHEEVADLFRDVANQRKRFATELGAYVYVNDGDLNPRGSLLKEVHRWWLDLTGKLQRGDSEVVLKEAERGEQALEEAYFRMLIETAGSPVNGVLQSQHREVHDSVERLRACRRRARQGGLS